MNKVLEIKVFPKSSRECILEKDGIIKIYIKVAPEKGKANKSVIDIISKKYKVKKCDVKILKGKTSKNKIIEVITND